MNARSEEQALERAALLEPVLHWTVDKKLALMRAVQNGIITLKDAREARALSAEEFEAWWSSYRRLGPRGLRKSAELVR